MVAKTLILPIVNMTTLASPRLISLAYGMIGFMQAATGFFMYFVVMAENGFFMWKLIGLREMWDSAAVNDLQDSYGQEWVREG